MRQRSGRAVATVNPLGNCVGAWVETSHGPDSVSAQFLIARSRTVPDLVNRPDTTPARGTGDICLPACGFIRSFWQGGNPTPVVAPHSPVARVYPSRARGGFFMPTRFDCSIKEHLYNTFSSSFRSAVFVQDAASIVRPAPLASERTPRQSLPRKCQGTPSVKAEGGDNISKRNGSPRNIAPPSTRSASESAAGSQSSSPPAEPPAGAR